MNPDQTANELLELLNQSRECAQYFGELGVETVDLSDGAVTSKSVKILPATSAQEPSTQRPTSPKSESPRPLMAAPALALPAPSLALFARPSPRQTAPAQSSSQSNERLEDVWNDIGECTRCGLCEGRTQVVNTFGNHNARLMFIGEAPGADEDAQGKPFVGRAGQLLTKIIEAIGMKREDVIIGNVNRCRPPGNRQPTLEEAAICRPFLFREITAIQPEVIVVMGNTALQNLLEVREGISRVRGKFRDFRGIKVMPTFHPAYLLRDPSKKREVWEDLKKVRDYLDNPAARTE